MTLRTAQKVRTSATKEALSLSYDYAFPARTTVYIEGVGEAPAAGRFEYISEAPMLVVKVSRGGTTLATVPLAPTVAVAAKPPLEALPEDAAFGAAYREFAWRSDVPIIARSTSVLGKYVTYRPREIDGVTELVTTFYPIDQRVGDRRVYGRLAMLFSFPHRGTGGSVIVRVKSIVEEGRPRSDQFRPVSDPALKAIADTRLRGIMTDIGLQ